MLKLWKFVRLPLVVAVVVGAVAAGLEVNAVMNGTATFNTADDTPVFLGLVAAVFVVVMFLKVLSKAFAAGERAGDSR